MYEDENEGGGFKKFLVALVLAFGLFFILAGIYMLIQTNINASMGYDYNYDLNITIWTCTILFGFLLMVLDIFLKRKLFPDSTELEKRKAKDESIAQKNIDRDRIAREKRAAKAQARMAKYQAEQAKQQVKEYKAYKKEYIDKYVKAFIDLKVLDTSPEVKIYLIKGFRWKELLEYFFGIGLMIGSFVVGLRSTETYKMGPSYRPSYPPEFYYVLVAVIVVFWIGIFFWLLGKSDYYFYNTSCFATKGDNIYLVTFKRLRLQEAQLISGYFAYGLTGKLINSTSTLIASSKYFTKVHEAFQREDFVEDVRRIIEEDELNKLFEIYDMRRSIKMPTRRKRQLYKEYLKCARE